MNERIKQLIKQATVLTDDPNERVQRLQLNPALLVELVVKECAKIAGKAEYSDTWLEPVEDAIKKHFGVE